MKNAISAYLSVIGKKGGEHGKGKPKARTEADAKAAADARWGKNRMTKRVVVAS
jgi:hypothetical protein